MKNRQQTISMNISKIANQILMKKSFHRGDRVIIEDPETKKHFWGTIKGFMHDKVKIFSDVTQKMIEIPINTIIASKK